MKVLLLSYQDSGGGAANATLRLTQALRERGIDADMGVVEKHTTHDWVIQLPPIRGFLQRTETLLKKTREKILFRNFNTANPVWHSLNIYSRIDVNALNESDYDIIHLNWIHNDMISIEDISRLKKPIVWTLHDSWLFCGAEHHPDVLENDQRFMYGYSKKNKPESTKGFDLCRYTAERKKKYLLEKELAIIAPSVFERDLLRQSALFARKTCRVIPNIVDRNVFNIRRSEKLKDILGIPSGKHIIGFGAAYDINNQKSIKGGQYLLQALRMLQAEEGGDDCFLVIFGPAGPDFLGELRMPYFSAGYVSNEQMLSGIYNICDVFVSPSVVESFGLTVGEASCCGVPVAAFNEGGIPDIVEHKKTGYLATCFDPRDLCEGIKFCIAHRDELSRGALTKSASLFSVDTVAKAHVEVYKSLVG